MRLRAIIAGLLVSLFLAAPAWAVGPSFSGSCNTISWNANQDTDLGGYKIYDRSNPNVGPTFLRSVGVQITSLPCSQFSFNAGQHYISISSFDTSNNESTLSPDVPFVIVGSPFPTTPLLDDFNRADTGPPPSGSWVNSLGAGLKVVSQALQPNAYGPSENDASTWNTSFAADQEGFFTIASRSPINEVGAWCLAVRLQTNTNWNADHYEVCAATHNGSDTIDLYKSVGAVVSTLITQSIGRSFVATDVVGVSAIGSAVTVFLNGAQQAAVIDSDVTAGGYIAALYGHTAGGTIDNVGGGAINTAVSDACGCDAH